MLASLKSGAIITPSQQTPVGKGNIVYRKGDLVEDFTEGRTYAREILDPQGDVICYVIEDRDSEKNCPGNTAADALLSHLNR